MLETLKKHWPKVSILLIVLILASLFFWPGISRGVGMGAMIFGLLMSITFLIHGHIQTYQKGELDKAALRRNVFVDVLGIFLTLVLVSLITGRLIQMVAAAVAPGVEHVWPGMGFLGSILSGLLVGMLVGVAIGLLVKVTWGKLAIPKRAADDALPEGN